MHADLCKTLAPHPFLPRAPRIPPGGTTRSFFFSFCLPSCKLHSLCACHSDTQVFMSCLSPYRSSSSSPFRLAIGSYIEQYSNVVSIIQKNPSSDDPTTSLYKAAEFDHPYPCTRLQWSPDSAQGATDLLATTGDYLRLWSLGRDIEPNTGRNPVKKEAVLNNNKASEFCAPLTSFDWNEADPSILGTCSIDTTCTIWDVVTQTPRTQLIAHDREVFDMAFSRGKDVFASVGKYERLDILSFFLSLHKSLKEISKLHHFRC